MRPVIFWIVAGTDPKYFVEANTSAHTVRRRMPDVPRILFSTNVGVAPRKLVDAFDDECHSGPWVKEYNWLLEQVIHLVSAIKQLRNAGYTHGLYLHTDTIMLRPVYDLFELVEHYCDMAGALERSRGSGFTLSKVPEAFPEIALSGMTMCFNDQMIAMLETLIARYKEAENSEDRRSGRKSYSDQSVMREVIYNNNTLRVYVLPPEYHMRFGGVDGCGYAVYDVKVAHGRGLTEQQLEKLMNPGGCLRVWRGEA